MQFAIPRYLHLQYWPHAARMLATVAAVVLLGLMPHVTHLPIWITALVVAAVTWRLWIELHAAALPARWLRNSIAVTALLAVAASYRTLNGLEAGTALLATMAGMKLIETRGIRDYTILIFISFFLLFAELLYNQNIAMLPYLLACAVFATATLMQLHDGDAHMSYREALKRSTRMLLQALPLAVLLFLFFPRLPGQFWAVPARDTATTGLSDEMSPGDVSDLSLSSSVAFRVEFNGALPPPAQLYWRAIVLHDFDGRTWRRERSGMPLPQVVSNATDFVDYRLLLEPNNQHWIPVLDVPLQWSLRRSFMTGDLQLVTPDPITQLTAVNARSATHYQFGTQLPLSTQRMDTRLSGNANPRTRALAQQLRSQNSDAADYIAAVLRMFNQQAFVYTLEPPRLEANAVDDFLFNTKRGFCEHYASAFTVLMRAAGIPARVVTGYQGGEFNSMGDYMIVRESDAHAWSEVWLDNRGWVRVDPTAAVAPQRIEHGINSALSFNESVPARALRQSQLFNRLRLGWDAINTYWKERIVEFDAGEQRSLMSLIGIDNTDWRSLGLALLGVFVVFFSTLMLYLAWRYRPKRHDPIVLAYTALKRKLARHQLFCAAYEGPADFLARVAAARPALAMQLKEIRDLYLELRYGPYPSAQQLSRLRYLISSLVVI